MNTIIRNWMPRQAAEADKLFRAMYGASLEERFTGDKYRLMHIEMFPEHIIHAECLGGDIDLLRSPSPLRFGDCHTASLRWSTRPLYRDHRLFAERVAVRRRRVVHRLGTLRVGRCVAMVEDDEYEEMIAQKATLPKTRFGDGYAPEHVESIQRLMRR